MNDILLAINSWMVSGTAMAALGCLLWGVVSVLLSPCHLASIPLIIGYVGGQNQLVQGRKAALYAVLFTFGLFITIALTGIACALLGRMLGDIGPWWTILVGLVLVWAALGMLGLVRGLPSGNIMARFSLRGATGALVLGLAYGLLSGSCTFGFIAPILAVITVQEKIATGIMLIALFGLGHCLPIALAGSSTAWVARLLENNAYSRAGLGLRRAAGILVGLLGVYFVLRPFLSLA